MSEVSRLAPAPFSTLSASRICLIKPSSLGDIVQSLPVFAALLWRFPRARISWVAATPYLPLLAPIAGLHETIEFPRGGQIQGWRSLGPVARLLRELSQRRFDLVVDLQGLLRSAAMAYATRSACRIGLASAREGATFFYTDIVDDRRADLAIDRYWKIAEALGVGHLPKEFPLSLSVEERRRAREQLAGLPRPLLAVHPGARWPTKRWPAVSFAHTARDAQDAAGGSVVLLGGSAEEQNAAAVVAQAAGPSRDLAGQLSLRQLAAVLEQCDVLLCNDSGPMHLSAAVGTPTVAMFTCTSPRRAAPAGDGHRCLETKVACRGSYLRQCDRLDCMRDLTPAAVVPVLIERLRRSMDMPSDRRRAA